MVSSREEFPKVRPQDIRTIAKPVEPETPKVNHGSKQGGGLTLANKEK